MLDHEPSLALVRIQDSWTRAHVQLFEHRIGSDARGALHGNAHHPASLPVSADAFTLAIQRAAQELPVTVERRRLVSDALQAEERARERISQLLHDEVLQSLLSARQDLAQAKRATSRERDALTQALEAVTDAIDKLRGVLAAEHPATRIIGGLQEAIAAIAALQARRGRFAVTLRIEPEARSVHDQLIVSLIQELLNNTTRHAQAGHVAISLSRTAHELVLEITDDGCGMDPGRPKEALGDGHIGLASIASRVDASGGQLRITTGAGEGTRVRVELPLCKARSRTSDDRMAKASSHSERFTADTAMQVATSAAHVSGGAVAMKVNAVAKLIARRADRPARARQLPGPAAGDRVRAGAGARHPTAGGAALPSTPRIRVYLVDDHPIYLRGIIQAVKQRPEFEFVGEALHGRQALADLQALKPDVAVLDMRIPGLRWLEVLAAVTRGGLETRIVFLSAHLESDLVYRAITAGAAGFLSKGAERDEILAAVAAVARGQVVVAAEAQGGLAQEIRRRETIECPVLTPREREVLALAADGLRAPEIAERLQLGATTVRGHLRNVYEKLGVSDRAAAVAQAMRTGLLH